jgi:hypothetical protein
MINTKELIKGTLTISPNFQDIFRAINQVSDSIFDQNEILICGAFEFVHGYVPGVKPLTRETIDAG